MDQSIQVGQTDKRFFIRVLQQIRILNILDPVNTHSFRLFRRLPFFNYITFRFIYFDKFSYQMWDFVLVVSVDTV